MNADLPEANALKAPAVLVARTAFSLAVSAGFVWLSLRGTDVPSVRAALTAAEPTALAGYFAILLAVHLVRTVRLRLLLAEGAEVGFWRLNVATGVGFMLLMILPLRLGELARPVLIARASNRLRISSAIASCVVERVFDGLAVGMLGLVSLYLLGSSASGDAAGFARRAAQLVTFGFAALCATLIVASLFRTRTKALVGRLGRFVSPPLLARATSMVDGFMNGVRLRSPWQVVAVVALTASQWALHAAGFVLVAGAFGLHLTALMGCAVVAVNVAGMMIPAGPGMIGTSQFFTQLGVSIFVAQAFSAQAVAARVAGFANAIWMLQFGQQVVTGLFFLAAGGVSLAGVLTARATDPASATRCTT